MKVSLLICILVELLCQKENLYIKPRTSKVQYYFYCNDLVLEVW